MTDNTNKVLQAIDQNHDLLNQLLNGGSNELTRSANNTNPIINILGTDVNPQELNTVSQEVASNPVVQLYLASSGSLDPKDLIDYVGGVNGTRAGNNQAVRALFDGRLDLKEIMIIMVLPHHIHHWMKEINPRLHSTERKYSIGMLAIPAVWIRVLIGPIG